MKQDLAVMKIGVLLSLFGVGALGYSTFWLVAAQRAPTLGSTGAAKESLRWMAMPTSAGLLLGLLLVIWMVLQGWRSRR